jgi:hypothetical protein
MIGLDIKFPMALILQVVFVVEVGYMKQVNGETKGVQKKK